MNFMIEIRTDIKRLLLQSPSAPKEVASPLSLTEYGEEIATAIRARSWALQHVAIVKDRVAGQPAWKVNEVAFGYAQDECALSPTMTEAMYEHGYTRDHVRSVLGVVLRDELLELSKE
ncbi:MAG: hypothetical protein OXD34_11955 [bacterium]|nr:hypothetical protein [bacterium]